jgi:Flp pilus assembly protein TadB
LTAVAVYLLTGLLFVVMAIMEYAYLLWIKRRTEIKHKRQVKSETEKYSMKKVSSASKTLDQMSEWYLPDESNYTTELTAHSYKVDTVGQIVSLSSFLLFNAIYWAHYGS